MPSGDELALDRIADWLGGRVAGFRGPLRAERFAGGQSNPTYLLEAAERRYVLRRKPPGKLLASAHAVDREFRVITALHRQGFPVPVPVVYCDAPSVVGTAFFVMGHVDGRIFPDLRINQSGKRKCEKPFEHTSLGKALVVMNGLAEPRHGRASDRIHTDRQSFSV